MVALTRAVSARGETIRLRQQPVHQPHDVRRVEAIKRTQAGVHHLVHRDCHPKHRRRAHVLTYLKAC
jgi:hypothetical protein